jgi:acyl-CoA thioester hydrolase
VSDWPFTHSDRVRFGDLDAMGHLNNVAFLQFFESARIAFLKSLIPEHNPADPSDFGLIFAECKINYRSPAFFDEDIATSVRPSTIARSSFRIEFEMRSEADQRVLAEGYGVLVGYRYSEGKSTPLPDRVKAALEPLVAA